MKKNNILAYNNIFLTSFAVPESPEEPQTSPEEQILHTPSRTCPNFLKTFLGDMQFDTRFALDRIISLGYLGWDEVTPEFLQILKRQPNINAAQQKMRELASKVNTKVGKVFDDAKGIPLSLNLAS